MLGHKDSTRTIWVSTTGERHPVKTMEDSHLCASLNFLAREARKRVPSLRTPTALDNYIEEHYITYPEMKAEAVRRGFWAPLSPLHELSPKDSFARHATVGTKEVRQDIVRYGSPPLVERVTSLELRFNKLRDDIETLQTAFVVATQPKQRRRTKK